MTDVSNLDDLALKISTSHNNIRNYAKAQAAATQSQELDIRQALSEVGPTGPTGPMGPPGPGNGGTNLDWSNIKDYGAIGNGSTDDRAAIQAAIDALPSAGGVVYFPQGSYKIVASGGIGLNLANKDSVTFVGERGVDFNAGTQGTLIKAGSASMTLISCAPSGNKQHGPGFIGLNFSDGGNNSVKLVRMINTNHWLFRDCGFYCNGTSAIGIEGDISAPGDDNNWSRLDSCKFSFGASSGTGGKALYFITAAVVAHNCVFNLNGGMIGVHLASGAANSKFTDCYFVGGTSTTGYMIDCAGHDNIFRGTTVENFDSPTNAAFRITGSANIVSESVMLSGNTGVEFTAASADNVMYGGVYHIGTAYTDAGTRNHIYDPGGGTVKIVNWSGGSLGFLGTSPATKQTVSGARDEPEGALKNLLTALANYGLITDSTTQT